MCLFTTIFHQDYIPPVRNFINIHFSLALRPSFFQTSAPSMHDFASHDVGLKYLVKAQAVRRFVIHAFVVLHDIAPPLARPRCPQ